MPSSRTYTWRTAHDHGIKQFAELYTYFVDRQDFNSAAWVLCFSSIDGLRYNVWRILSMGLYPFQDHIETWAVVACDNLETF
jgi:hypothetical protein